MPGGHASHKGNSVKPNTNAEGQLDIAADLEVDPQALTPEGPDAHRAETAPENKAATQRPNKQDNEQDTE